MFYFYSDVSHDLENEYEIELLALTNKGQQNKLRGDRNEIFEQVHIENTRPASRNRRNKQKTKTDEILTRAEMKTLKENTKRRRNTHIV